MAAEESLLAVSRESLRSLSDPFDIKARVPELVRLFLQGLEDLKRQAETPPAVPELEPEREVPFRPPEPVFVPPPTPVERPVSAVPALAVTGIVFDTALPQAIINGKVVQAGDTVDGVRIVKISKGMIDGRFEDRDVQIKFNNQ